MTPFMENPNSEENLLSSFQSKWSILWRKWIDSLIISRPCQDFGFSSVTDGGIVKDVYVAAVATYEIWIAAYLWFF